MRSGESARRKRKVREKVITIRGTPRRRIVIDSFKNSVGMTFVALPEGDYIMGSNEHESEQPPHQVHVEEFYMGSTPVTQAQYQAVMGTNPSRFTGDTNRPVEQVNYYEALEFVRKLNELEGLSPEEGYYLPTEEEWEYACRAGSTTRYFWGDEFEDIENYGWHGGNSNGSTQPVGQKEPNAWELYDMIGNVWEWTRSIYEPYSERIARQQREQQVAESHVTVRRSIEV
jgi:formylglycine-generating enzyme required for sulfatase activity